MSSAWGDSFGACGDGGTGETVYVEAIRTADAVISATASIAPQVLTADVVAVASASTETTILSTDCVDAFEANA